MKNLLKLGKALNKAEQKQINGGRGLVEDPCNGCPFDALRNCCVHDYHNGETHHDDPLNHWPSSCSATTVITANGLPMCHTI